MKPWIYRLIKWGVLSVLLGVFAWVLCWWVFPFRAEAIAAYPQGALIQDREGQVLRKTLGPMDSDCVPVGIDWMSTWVGKAIVAAEDKRFYQHAGVDPVAVMRSSVINLKKRRVATGASTISTQVIRMAEPRDRTLGTKVVEAFRAAQMERHLGKEEILEQYLNRAPLGGNLYGVESASQRYFDKPASELSLGEAALLMGLPQSPSRYRPDRHLERALKRRSYVLRKMVANGSISERQRASAEAQPVSVAWHHAPFSAPHFCDWLLKDHALEGPVRSTLDPRLQDIAERHATRGAVVILEVATGAVRAMVGSPDYFDAAIDGQVNGALAKRSPGSTLKPFAYAWAIEQGLLTPDTVIDDRQLAFRDYRPSNYDRTFSGKVSVREALVRSLNIPAIEAVRKTGLPTFYGVLQDVGLGTIDRSADHYGLSLVLGTCEVRLLDLANAYAVLAREGEYLPVRALATTPQETPRRVFSAATAYLVSDMLSGDERQVALSGHRADVTAPRIAWKTGTSTGNRDAWTVAYNPEYVVGVWTGYADGTSSPEFVGIAAAAPVAHDIFRALYPDGHAPWFKRPEAVRSRELCAETGLPASTQCTATHAGMFIAGQSSHGRCAHRVAAPVDAPMVMLSPPPDARYQLTGYEGDAWQQKLVLKARASGAEDVFWFINGELYTSSTWALVPGRHEFRCVDEKGRSAQTTVVVQGP